MLLIKRKSQGCDVAKSENSLSSLSYLPSFFLLLFLFFLFFVFFFCHFNVTRKPPVVTKTGKRRVQLAKGAAASLLSSASKFLILPLSNVKDNYS